MATITATAPMITAMAHGTTTTTGTAKATITVPGMGPGATGTRTTAATKSTTRATPRSARLPLVPRLRTFRRTGTIGLALTAWDIWRRIPKKHRRMIIQQARVHGPKVASKVVEQARRHRRPH